MKKLRIFLSIGLLGLLTACGTTQTTTADTQTSDRGRSNSVSSNTNNSPASPRQANRTAVSTTSSTGQRQATADTSVSTKTTTATANRNTVAEEEARMQKMYSDLEMTQDQRSRFEREWKNASESWKKSNRNKTMNSFERTEYQDQILKDIFTEQQFQNYQQWARENAGTKD